MASVLVVDDDEDMRDTVAALLELKGHRVRTAADGQRALDAVAREMPDLVLLDLKMPVLNGWEFAAAYRARWPEATRAPIVILSAVDDPAQRAHETGAVAWIGKPFDVADLIEIVGRHASPRSRPSPKEVGQPATK